MGLSLGGGAQEKWKMEDLRGLQGVKQGYIEGSLPPPIYRPSIGHVSREEIFLFSGWLQRI